MMSVHEVSELTGVSIRALHHYDNIGLLLPSEITEAGYRLYDDRALERLQQIMLFRELEFTLSEIKTILDSPWFDRKKALKQQIELLKLRKDRLQYLIDFAQGIKDTGEIKMNFDAFDTKKIDEYAAKAKKQWGGTDAYKEYEQKNAGRSMETQQALGTEMMDIFKEFGDIRNSDPKSAEAAALVRKLQKHITDNYYKCTDVILISLGQMYSGDDAFRKNIDAAGGEGTAAFVTKAIEAALK